MASGRFRRSKQTGVNWEACFWKKCVRRQSYKNRSSYKSTSISELSEAVRLLKSTNWSNDCSKSRKTHILKQNILFQVKHVVFCFYLSFCWFCLTCLPETIFSVSFFCCFYVFVCSPSHWYIDTFLHWIVVHQWLIHRFHESLMSHWFIGSLTHQRLTGSSFNHWFIGSLICWFTDWFVDSLFHWFIALLL